MPPARPPGSTSEPAVGACARRGVGAAARAAARALAANIRPATHTRASNSRAYATTWQRRRDAARQRSVTRPWAPLRVAAGLSRRQAAATRESRQQTAKKKKKEREACAARSDSDREGAARAVLPPLHVSLNCGAWREGPLQGRPRRPSVAERARPRRHRPGPPARARARARSRARLGARSRPFSNKCRPNKNNNKNARRHRQRESARRIGHPWVR